MRFVTLGPDGTCHSNATRAYFQHHGIEDGEIVFIEDFFEGLEMLHNGDADCLLQNTSMLNVHLITEKYYQEIRAIDTFLYPTGEMALLENAHVEHPQTLGLVKATEGYLDDITYPEMIIEPSKLAVGRNLLAGKYDAGIAYLSHYTDNPGHFRMRKYIGSVLTAWLVYGRETTFEKKLTGALPVGYYTNRHGDTQSARAVATKMLEIPVED